MNKDYLLLQANEISYKPWYNSNSELTEDVMFSEFLENFAKNSFIFLKNMLCYIT